MEVNEITEGVGVDRKEKRPKEIQRLRPNSLKKQSLKCADMLKAFYKIEL